MLRHACLSQHPFLHLAGYRAVTLKPSQTIPSGPRNIVSGVSRDPGGELEDTAIMCITGNTQRARSNLVRKPTTTQDYSAKTRSDGRDVGEIENGR
ncbi:hypothetical protein CHU98_g1722 [Xylaria longipes]|nr:hypothetical protein CHU98_g1722 [Xylaria longipes]